MKKLISSLLIASLLICACATFVGCSEDRYCDPRGKEWYNSPSLPDISNPFEEIYDDSYTIRIDKDGRVELTTITGETVEGTLTASYNGSNWRSARISIEFENGETATGWCYKHADGRILSINYKWIVYSFADKKQLTKEEFEEYRLKFVDFLIGVYQTGTFPTEEEIKANSLYRRFTDCRQECHNGPFIYDCVEKATIEKIESLEYDEYMKNVTLTVDGESKVYSLWEDASIGVIRNGIVEKLDFGDLKEGDCLVTLYENDHTNERVIEGLFYIENN